MVRSQSKAKLAKWLWQFLGEYHSTWNIGLALMAISRLAAASIALGTKFLVDEVLGKRGSHLTAIVACMAGAIVIQAGASSAMTRLIGRRSHRMLAKLRAKVFAHTLGLPLSRHDASNSGGMAAQIFHDTDALRHALGFPFMDFTGAAITCVAAGAILAYLDWKLAAIAAALLCAFATAFRACALATKELAKERASLIASASGQMAESLGAIRAVKAFAAESREEGRFAVRLHGLVANADRSTRLSAMIAAVQVVLSGGGVVLLLGVGVRQVTTGRLSTGGLLAAMVLCGLVAGAFLQAGKVWLQIAESLAGAERIRELLDGPREDCGREDAIVVERLRGWLEFDNVSFNYDRGVPVLDGISFRAAPGAMIALVGASGAGKSTIASLAAAFYQPTSGRVLVDGLDLREVNLRSYRRLLGVVSQDPLLLEGTIAENVALGRPGATQEEIREACRQAYVDEFAERLPLGYDTPVGERGVQLSGGQRQRIAIARALLVNPSILILDEPTATLDDGSEHIVQRALEAAARGRTTLLITHRDSALAGADQVLVLAEGRIMQRTPQLEVPQV